MGSSGRSVQWDHPKTVENAMKQVKIDLRPRLKTQLVQMEENQLILEASYQREINMDPQPTMTAKDDLKKEDAEFLAHLTPLEREQIQKLVQDRMKSRMASLSDPDAEFHMKEEQLAVIDEMGIQDLNLSKDIPENAKCVNFVEEPEVQFLHEPWPAAEPSFDEVQATAAEIEFMMSCSMKPTTELRTTKNPKTKNKNSKKADYAMYQPTPASSTGSTSFPRETHQTLAWKILKAMALLSMLTLTAQTSLQQLLRGDQVHGWELFCAPESWLTAACRSEGLRMPRINLHQGYDLYKKDTYDQLLKKYKRERPRRLWISTRCTYWCPFTSLNYQTVASKTVLAHHRRRERAIFRLLVPFLLEVVTMDPDVELWWEWPKRCYGWDEPDFHRLVRGLRALGKDWYHANVDGCRYGLKSSRGRFLRKSWSIGTTSQTFYAKYRSKTCTGNHEHDRVQGIETNRSAYYPWSFGKSIAQHWCGELYPEKWLHRLQDPLPCYITEDEQYQSLGLHELQVADEAEHKQVDASLESEQLLMVHHLVQGHPSLKKWLKKKGWPSRFHFGDFW